MGPGAGAGGGAAVAAVAVRAALDLLRPSRQRSGASARWLVYVVAGAAAAATAGSWVVVVLLACGVLELGVRSGARAALLVPPPLLLAAGTGGALSLIWTAFKVGALSYGGGFVIVPLMQNDAVGVHHWLTNANS